MLERVTLTVDLDAIAASARTVAAALPGIEIVGVTKCTCGSPEVARALEANYSALKDRLRQLGFFTDLSDASISQVIRPRFPINSDAV